VRKKITRIRVRGGNFKFRALRLDHGNYSWAGEAVTRKTRILKVVYNSTNNELVRTNTLVKGSIIQIDSTPFKAWYLQYYNIDLSNKKEIIAATDKKVKEDVEKPTTKKTEKTKKEEKPKKEEQPKPTKEPKEEKGKKATPQEPKEEKGKKATPQERKSEKGKADATKGKGAKAKADTTKGGKKPKIQEDRSKKDLTKNAEARFTRRNSKRILEAALADQYRTGRLYAKITSRPGQSGRCDGYILEGEELAFYLKKINLKKKK